MPILASTKRALRKAINNRAGNVDFMEKYRKLLKSFKLKPGKEGLDEVYAKIDKGVKRGVFHKNKAARLKSRMSGMVKKNTKKMA